MPSWMRVLDTTRIAEIRQESGSRLTKIARDMSNPSDSVIDPKLAAKLQAGKRVPLKRNWRNITPPAILTLFPLLVVAMAYRQDPSVLLLLVFFWPFAAWLWWRAMANRLQFAESAVEATDQNLGLSQHRIQLGEIVAAWIAPIREIRIGRRAFKDANCVYVCELTPGQRRASRSVALWITQYGINANTLLAELRRRCELSEISLVSGDYRTTVWQRPGLDPNVLPVPRWQKPLDSA
jgi:hypothetical protein